MATEYSNKFNMLDKEFFKKELEKELFRKHSAWIYKLVENLDHQGVQCKCI